MTTWQKVLDIIESMGRVSTAHGVSHLFNANNTVKKSLWLICILLAGFLFITLASMNVLDYLEYQVTTKIRFHDEKTSDFPAVAICNYNPFVTEYAIDFLIGLIEKTSPNSSKPQNLSKIELINEHLKTNPYLKDHVRYLVWSESMSNTEKQKLGFPLKKVILSCRFNTMDCIDTGFTWKYSWQYGNCYVFNSDNQFKLQTKGENFGLTIELFKGFDELAPIFEPESGLKLIIYNQTNDFENDYYMEKIGLEPGKSIKLSFKRNFIEKLNKPYSECDLDLNTATIDYVYDEVFVQKKFGRFAKDCPLECNTNEFIFQASSDSYPSYYYGLELLKNCPIFQEKFFNRSLEIKDLAASTLKVSIYSQRLGYQLFTEVPTTTIIGLLSDTGGMLGTVNF